MRLRRLLVSSSDSSPVGYPHYRLDPRPPFFPFFLSFPHPRLVRSEILYSSKARSQRRLISLLKWLFQTLRFCSGTERSPQNPYISMLSPIRTTLSNRPQHPLPYPPSVACPSNIYRTSFPLVSTPEPSSAVTETSRLFGQTVLTFSSQFDHLSSSECRPLIAHALLACFDAPITCIFRSIRSSCDRTP